MTPKHTTISAEIQSFHAHSKLIIRNSLLFLVVALKASCMSTQLPLESPYLQGPVAEPSRAFRYFISPEDPLTVVFLSGDLQLKTKLAPSEEMFRIWVGGSEVSRFMSSKKDLLSVPYLEDNQVVLSFYESQDTNQYEKAKLVLDKETGNIWMRKDQDLLVEEFRMSDQSYAQVLEWADEKNDTWQLTFFQPNQATGSSCSVTDAAWQSLDLPTHARTTFLQRCQTYDAH